MAISANIPTSSEVDSECHTQYLTKRVKNVIDIAGAWHIGAELNNNRAGPRDVITEEWVFL